MTSTIRIATRGSKLALWQANHVASLLKNLGYMSELQIIKTQGDIVQDRFLHEIGGKGLFVKELEKSMGDGETDIAVHSLKDLPARLHPNFCLAAVLKRHSPKDVMIFKPESWSQLQIPPGDLSLEGLRALGPMTVATASLRRQSLLKMASRELSLQPVRGNVDTRINKLMTGSWDALILAHASLERLGLKDLHTRCLGTDWFVPSPAQGALAIECRNDHPLRDVLARLDHADTHKAVRIERKILELLGGDCSMPFACFTSEASPGQTTIRTRVLNYSGEAACSTVTVQKSIAQLDEGEAIRLVMEELQQDNLARILEDLKFAPPDLGPLTN